MGDCTGGVDTILGYTAPYSFALPPSTSHFALLVVSVRAVFWAVVHIPLFEIPKLQRGLIFRSNSRRRNGDDEKPRVLFVYSLQPNTFFTNFPWNKPYIDKKLRV